MISSYKEQRKNLESDVKDANAGLEKFEASRSQKRTCEGDGRVPNTPIENAEAMAVKITSICYVLTRVSINYQKR